MFKKLKKIFLLLALPFTLTYLSSCSFFNMEEEGYLIKSIETETFEDGTTKVTITYDNEEVDPVEFYIPKGNQGEIGETGNGIAGIENKGKDSTGEYTILEITYTDNTVPPTKFQVPNGVSVEKMESKYNEETGITTVTITLTNGEKMSFEVPRGKDGKDGNGISYIDQKINEDKSVDLIIHYTNGGTTTVSIAAPIKGDTGNGIASMSVTENNTHYIITITYTNGKSDTLELSKPQDPNTWLSGYGIPDDALGKNGDFYFDLNNKNIYGKSGGQWTLIHSFTDSGELYEVTFNINDSVDAPATMNGELVYHIERGNYFASSGYVIPEPVRSGYTFLGWYTVKNPTAVNGAFTDLTPVFSDLTLYANWSLN